MQEENTHLIFTILITSIAFVVSLYFDFRYQRIPNLLCLSVLFVGISFQFYSNDLLGLGNAFLGVFIAFAILFPAFLFKALGAGDVKLMMAVGSLLGPYLVAWSIGYAIIVGGITSLILTLYKTGWKGMKTTFIRYYQCFYTKQYFKPEEGEAAALRVPYAPALALGWLWACSQNDDVLWAISNFKYAMSS